MDMRICVLGSSSSGNATVIWTSNTKIMIDAGFSARELEKRLSSINVSPKEFKAILISHEHADHTKGAAVLSRRYEIPVFANRTTFRLSSGLENVWEKKFFKSHEEFVIEDFSIMPLVVPHDASEPNAFIIKNGGKKVTVATDLGRHTSAFVDGAKNSDMFIIESNYDDEMLECGDYHPVLKERIASDFGHLSNDAAARTLRQVIGNSTRHVLLAHISQNNNTPDLAISCAKKNLGNFKNLIIEMTYPHKCSKVIKL